MTTRPLILGIAIVWGILASSVSHAACSAPSNGVFPLPISNDVDTITTGRAVAAASSGFTASEGSIAYDTTADALKSCDGTSWNTISGGASVLSGLTDVSASVPAGGQMLRYNGTKWEATAPSNVISTTTMVVSFPDAVKCGLGADVNQTMYLYYSARTSGGEHYYYYPGNATYSVVFNSSGGYFSQSNLATTGSWACTTGLTISQLYSEGRAFNFIGSNGAVALTTGVSGSILFRDQNGSPTAVAGMTYNPSGISVTGYISASGNIFTADLKAQNISSTGVIQSNGISVTGTITATTVSVTGNLFTRGISTTTLWVNGVSITGSGGASALSGLSDVSASSASSGQMLRYNGSKWEATAPSNVISTTTMVTGWPDAIICDPTNPGWGKTTFWRALDDTANIQYVVINNGIYLAYRFNNSTGAYVDYYYNAPAQAGGGDCINKSITNLYTDGQAFNFIGSNGAVALTTGVSGSILFRDQNGSPTAVAGMTYNPNGISVTGYISASGNIFSAGISTTTLWVNGVSITGSGGASAAGSLGQIQFNGGGTTLSATSAFYASSTTGRLGIGTTTPQTTLEVNGIISSTGLSVTGVISASSHIVLGTSTATCGAGTKGAIRYSTTSSTVEYCNSGAWTSLGPSDTSTVSFHAYRGSNQTISANTWTKVQLGSTLFNTGGFFSTASYQFSPTVPGKYLFTGAVTMTSNVDGNTIYACIYKNNACTNRVAVGHSTSEATANVTTVLENDGNDYFELFVWSQNTTVYGGSNVTYFSGSLLGPQGDGSTFQAADGSVGAPGQSFLNDSDTGWWRPTTNTMAASTGGSERMRIDTSGNVGIGTTNPQTKLEVNGTVSTTGIVGGGMTSYTPTVTSVAGSLGSNPPTATGSYYDVGPLRFVDIVITFPSNYSSGSPTASGDIRATLPSASAAYINTSGREVAVVGWPLSILGFTNSNQIVFTKLTDLSFVAGNSYQFHGALWYRK